MWQVLTNRSALFHCSVAMLFENFFITLGPAKQFLLCSLISPIGFWIIKQIVQRPLTEGESISVQLVLRFTCLGSGCGSVCRAVASDSRGPQFESSHWQKFILNIYCQLYWKDENKEKEAGKDLFKKVLPPYLLITLQHKNSNILFGWIQTS